MKCKEVVERLSEYWSNELDEKVKEGITAHLRVCPSCQHEWEILRAAMNALQSVPTPEPPPQLLNRIRSEVMAKQHRKPMFVWRWQWAMAFGTAAIAIAIALIPFMSQRRATRLPVVAEAPAPLISPMPMERTLPKSTRTAPSPPSLKPSMPSPMERIAKPHKSVTKSEHHRAERMEKEISEAVKLTPPSPSMSLPALSVPSGERLPEQQKDIDIPADIAPAPGKENQPQLAELPFQPRRVPFRAELEFSERRVQVPGAGVTEPAKVLSSPRETRGSPPEPQGPAVAMPQVAPPKSVEATLMGQHFPTITQQYGGGLRQTLPAISFSLRWAKFEPVVVGKVRLWELMLGSDIPQVVTVFVQPGEKVEILNAQQPTAGESKGLIVWRDKLPSGKEVSIPILLRASEVGTRKLLVTVETMDGKTSSWWCIFPATVREEQPRVRRIVPLQVEQWTVVDLLAHLAWEGKVAFLVPEQISHRTVHVPTRAMPLSEIFTLLGQQTGGRFIRFRNTFSWVSPVPAVAVPFIKQ